LSTNCLALLIPVCILKVLGSGAKQKVWGCSQHGNQRKAEDTDGWQKTKTDTC